MARAILLGMGGSGADLDAITADQTDVAKGKVIVDKEGDPLTGTLELTGNAQPAQVLNDYTFYNTDLKTKRTGTIPVRTSSNSSVNAGGSVSYSAGYYPSSFTISGNSLASQTPADAGANHILANKTAWVNGSKITGTMAVQSILSFSAAPYGNKQIIFTWKNPSKGPFSGVVIRGTTQTYPSNINSGTEYYVGSGSNSTPGGTSTVIITTKHSTDVNIYFRAFSYVTRTGSGDANNRWVHSTTYTAIAKPIPDVGYYNSTMDITIPQGITKIDMFCVGGGGGGGGANHGIAGSVAACTGGSGGGGGYTKERLDYPVREGQVLTIIIGAGGAGGAAGQGHPGGAGSSSSIVTAGRGGTTSIEISSASISNPTTVLVSAEGGYGGATSGLYGSTGGKGGSGGGGGGASGLSRNGASGGKGGTDGGDGSSAQTSDGSYNSITRGTGQGTTTICSFDDREAITAYGGGGGGGGAYQGSDGYSPGTGGGGGYYGGGSGGSPSSLNGTNGTNGSGSGGGGGGSWWDSSGTYTDIGSGGTGGSGAVIIRFRA